MDMVTAVRASTLLELKRGEKGIIHNLGGDNKLRERLAEMGFVRGVEVTLDRTAPLGNPRVYVIYGSRVSLRNEEARQIALQNQ